LIWREVHIERWTGTRLAVHYEYPSIDFAESLSARRISKLFDAWVWISFGGSRPAGEQSRSLFRTWLVHNVSPYLYFITRSMAETYNSNPRYMTTKTSSVHDDLNILIVKLFNIPELLRNTLQ